MIAVKCACHLSEGPANSHGMTVAPYQASYSKPREVRRCVVRAGTPSGQAGRAPRTVRRLPMRTAKPQHKAEASPGGFG